MMMLLETIQYLVPNAELTMRGEPDTADKYETDVQWLDSRPQPTWAQIEAARETVADIHKRQEIEAVRRMSYIQEADPLFFGWQRGENTEKEWLDKVAEIRARHPYA